MMHAKRSYRIPWLISRFLRILAIGAISIFLPAQASLFTQTLDFKAIDQSLWGTGGSIGFNYSDSIGFTVLGVDLSVGYSIGASSGQVSARFKGDLAAGYVPTLASPGTTGINLSFQGQKEEWIFGTWCPFPNICIPIPIDYIPPGGELTSNLGAHAQLTFSGYPVGPDLTLEINKGFEPRLDQMVSGSDSEPNVVQIGVLPLNAAGVSLGVTQTSYFAATGINGLLYYTRQGSGIVNSSPFTLATDSGLTLPVTLTEPGIWDFWFVDQTLENSFSTSLDLDLGLFVNYPCFPDVWNTCTDNLDLVSPTVYSGNPFSLAFNRITNQSGFSILVNEAAAPEPGALALLGLGLAGVAATRRRRR